jgi:hypothetical protein
MQNKVVSLPEQTIIDLVIQEMGTIEGLFDFMKANNIGSLEIDANALFNVPAVLRPELVQYLKSSNKSAGKEPIQISTGLQTIPAPGTGGGEVHIFNSDLSIDETITAPGERELEDITITLVNTADETISTETLAAAVDGTVTAPDGTVVLKRSNGTVIDSQIVKSGSSIDKTITNSTVIVRNSASTIIGNYSVNAQTTLSTSMADKSFTVRRSDGTTINTIPIVAGVDGSYNVNDSIVWIKNTLGTILTTQDVRAAASIDKVLSNISFTDSDGSVSPVPAGVNITATAQVKSTFIRGIFEAGSDTMSTLTIDSDTAGTFTSITDDGSSGSITLSKNGSAFAAFSSPLVLAATDTLVVKRTVSSASGFYKITGTYV